MWRYLAVGAVVLSLAAVSCARSGDLPGDGATPQLPATPLPPATALPAATPSFQVATPIKPVPTATAVPPQEPAPTPSALPWVSIEYGGRVHHGKQGSYCWPVSVNRKPCIDKIGWEDFDSAPAVSVKRGDALSVVVTTDESSPGEVHVQVYTVQMTEPSLVPGDVVFSGPAADGTRLDLPPGVYFLSAFYKSGLGDVSYGFRLEMVD